MNRSSVTVRGSDCDAGAPMKMPSKVSKPAVAKFRSIVAFRQPMSRRAPGNIAPSDRNQNDTNHVRGNAWRGAGNPRYGLVLLLMRGRNGRSGRPRRVQCSGKFLAEFIELAGIDVADHPQIEAALAPMADVKSLHGFVLDAVDCGAQWLADEQIDHVLAPVIDDRGHRLAVDVIEPAADQGKTLRRQVDDRRGDVELAVEPRLDGVLVAGFDVGQMAGLQRAQMRRHDVAGDLLILVVADHGNDEARGHDGRQRGADSKTAEEIFPGFAQRGEPRWAR